MLLVLHAKPPPLFYKIQPQSQTTKRGTFLASFRRSVPAMARFSMLVLGLACLSLAAAFHMLEESGDAAVEAAQAMLRKYNLPEELLPVSLVAEFSFDRDDRSFRMRFEESCYVKVSNEYLWYGEEIRGRVSYGRMEDLSGIQSKMLLVWLPVRQLHVDDVESGYVYMEIGPTYKKLSTSTFQSPLPCHNDDTGLFSLFSFINE